MSTKTAVTFFTVVKPFRDEFRQIQINAIQSWQQLTPAPEIIVFGRAEYGAKTACKQMGLQVETVRRNEQNTPLLRHLFNKARDMASNEILCYLNADIIVLPGFLEAVERVAARFDRFLLSARRYDLLTRIIPPFDVLERLCTPSRLHGPSGIDVFCYRGLDFAPIPDLAIGRGKWDNWLVAKAISSSVPFVDCTGAVTVIHQAHEIYYTDEELAANCTLYETEFARPYLHGFVSATHTLTSEGIQRTRYGKTRGLEK